MFMNISLVINRLRQHLSLMAMRLGLNRMPKQHDTSPAVAAFEWRGLMLDVARHAVSVEYLKKLIDNMSEHGLNRLHLHLSDDQGWRVEIKKYPRLHTVGGTRSETVIGQNMPSKLRPYKGDGKAYAAYYTQQELSDLVQYGKAKGVILVPEIDLPGHATALLAAYPEYSAGKPPQEVATYWGVFDNVVRDDEKTISFLKDIFDELASVFDGLYFHIGGDEVPLANYRGDAERPKNVLREVAQYLKQKGREVILWDDAADVAREVGCIVMVWRDQKDGYRILKEGGRVIFTPTSHFYFDYYQADPKHEPLAIGGYIPKEQVEAFSIDPNIVAEYKDSILGIQANVWTEYMPTEDAVDYMLYPRFYSLAKVAARGMG